MIKAFWRDSLKFAQRHLKKTTTKAKKTSNQLRLVLADASVTSKDPNDGTHSFGDEYPPGNYTRVAQ